MRWIYVSPHLDDAVLSAGGLIYEQARAGQPVEIWTMMSGFPPEEAISPLAQVLHYQWGFPTAEEAIRGRRAEDEAAAAMVGAKTVHFDFLDCIYRRGADGSWLYAMGVFDPPVDEEADLPDQIAAALLARLQPDDQVICQFSVGRHVDHVTVRRAVERLGRLLWYDVDLPYAFNHPEEAAPNTAGMKESLQPVTETGLRAWLEAIQAYKSQLSSIFETPEGLLEAVRASWRDKGGIGLWRPE
ncbi:MAG: PIG-L family deacetylase [Chloroflexi bacterium]|nr:PIG-L family deacetylase [Chloroflexota bacterium]